MKVLSTIVLLFFVQDVLYTQQDASPKAARSVKERLVTDSLCDHESNSMRRFEAIRVLPPVQIDMFNGVDLTYRHHDLKWIHILNIDNRTVMPERFSKTYREHLWWIVYSKCDNHIYLIAEPTPSQVYGGKTKQ